MLRNKSTTIISDLNDFFTSSEKAINTILIITRSLTISEKQIQIGLESKCNNEFKNINKLLILLMFPFFDVPDAWNYSKSVLYPVFSCRKDVFYRLRNSDFINWRKISNKIPAIYNSLILHTLYKLIF